MSTKLNTTWLIVGDGATAQFYSVHAIPLRLTKVPAGALKATRKLTHGGEHQPQNLHIAHLPAGRGDHQRHENVFVEHVAEALDVAAREGEYDQIVVVLPPKALAHFRKVATEGVRQRIKREIAGDWTHLPMPKLEEHFAAELP